MSSSLYVCIIENRGGNPAAESELLAAAGFAFASSTDTETGVTRHACYFEDRPAAVDARRKIKAFIAGIKGCGLDSCDVGIEKLRREDWTEIWKKYFKVVRISPKLVVKPSWLKYSPRRKDVAIIHIDPGMSFGTGKHATTKMTLRLVGKSRIPGRTQSFCDVGCGSGILMIGAAKLGYSPLLGIDNDPLSVKVAEENLGINAIDRKSYRLHSADLADFNPRRRFDVIAANIISGTLTEHSRILKSWLKPGGTLIVSGIMEGEYLQVLKIFNALGLHEKEALSEDGWTAAALR
jgi:ribosomal protein L11 methyltransferase